ncbi:MAG: hypothetical protein KIT69_11110, partial [Propionibacteriaceae bacterium]|nr:hypothetical protein [Propionibacteriaceae bacterium]
DLPLAPAPAPAASHRWVHVGGPRPGVTRPATVPQARSLSSSLPGGRPGGVAAPQLVGRASATTSPSVAGPVVDMTAPALRLTRRGLAVVMGAFALVMMTALVVLVAAFLAVPNEPVGTQLLLG